MTVAAEASEAAAAVIARFGLNPEQAAAAAHLDGPALALAGAGTGKTRVLTARTAAVLEARRPVAKRVLVVTFKREAAAELRARVAEALGGDDRRLLARVETGTFHAVAARLLRERPDVAGLPRDFKIADDQVCLELLGDVVQARARRPVDAGFIAAVAELIAQAKRDGVAPQAAELDGWAQAQPPERIGLVTAAVGAYPEYQARLREAGLADFGDLLLWPTRAMEADERLRRRWAARYCDVMADEYQDADDQQARWLELLASDNGNLFVVGDDSQSLYGWRGAKVRNILDFAERWPGCAVYRLVRNYRCSPVILGAANAVIAHNRHRLPKELMPAAEAMPGASETIEVRRARDCAEEAAWVVGDAARVLKAGQASLVYVLYRANWLGAAVEEACVDAGLPYALVGDKPFYDREVTGLVLDHLRLVAGSEEEAAAARERLARFWEKDLEPVEQGLRRNWPENARAMTIVHVLSQLNVFDMLDQMRPFSADERRRNLEALVERLQDLGRPRAVLDRAARALALHDRDAPLRLMTLHASKGLEADHVYLVGWAEGTFPTRQSLDAAALGDAMVMEEERNIAYVGITRARRRAVVTWPDELGAPSRFIAELPRELVSFGPCGPGQVEAPGEADAGPFGRTRMWGLRKLTRLTA